MARKPYERVQTHFEGPSLTRQEFKDECDLGMTIKRFAKTPDGMRALANAQGFAETAHFDDVTALGDFRHVNDVILAAKGKFMALPAIVRKRFSNDPAEFLDFVTNPENLDECRKMGLAKPKEDPIRDPKEV